MPTLTGLNADEASSQAGYGQIPAAQWREQVGKRFGDLAAAFLKLYPAANDAQAGASQKAASRDQGRVSMYLWAVNRAKTAKTKLFTYCWDHAEPGQDSARYAAFHTSEVPYVFNTLNKSDRPWTAVDRKIAETMGAYWVNFMTHRRSQRQRSGRLAGVRRETGDHGDRRQVRPDCGGGPGRD